MAISHPISDMLTKIRNANMVKHNRVEFSFSKMNVALMQILEKEGYIKGFKEINTNNGFKNLRVFLKYTNEDKPVIHGIKTISKPGRRQYSSASELPRIFNGFGTLIVSTSKGVITGREAKEQNVGGELICSIW